ncbi:MAG: Mobile element protein [Gemmatimonadetes bacterium]|nr:Mobile element protein [Gemmatimonadota bacterium]
MTTRRAYPTDVTDAEWERIKPLLPNPDRQRKHSLREVVNGLFYHIRGGASRRMLPNEFPPWETVYGFFNRWSKRAYSSVFTTRCESKPESLPGERLSRAPGSSTRKP